MERTGSAATGVLQKLAPLIILNRRVVGLASQGN